MGLLDDFFGEQGLDVPNPTMTKDEYINQAREWIAKVNDIYWRNWGYRTLNDDELPSEEVCESCNNHCVITIGEYTYDCHPDHESGVCRIRVFDEGNYSDEMEELMNEFDYMDLINPEVELTDLKPVEIPEISDEMLELDNPWNTMDVITKLIWATEYLLHNKSYDGHNYEELNICVTRGKEILHYMKEWYREEQRKRMTK
jgi:hypothetical protein